MTMVEKITRAIAKAASGSEGNWIDYQDEALAALKALREPSRGMVGHVVDTVFDGGIEDANLIPEIFTAAIDAAIQEHEGP